MVGRTEIIKFIDVNFKRKNDNKTYCNLSRLLRWDNRAVRRRGKQGVSGCHHSGSQIVGCRIFHLEHGCLKYPETRIKCKVTKECPKMQRTELKLYYEIKIL